MSLSTASVSSSFNISETAWIATSLPVFFSGQNWNDPVAFSWEVSLQFLQWYFSVFSRYLMVLNQVFYPRASIYMLRKRSDVLLFYLSIIFWSYLLLLFLTLLLVYRNFLRLVFYVSSLHVDLKGQLKFMSLYSFSYHIWIKKKFFYLPIFPFW